MKTILTILFALAVSGTLCAAETSNVDYGQSTTSPTLTLVWKYKTQTDNGVTYAVITGLYDEDASAPSGAITVPTTVYDGTHGYVVKAIADGTFKNQIGITSITIPLTVQTIGNGVFTGCTVLSAITVDSANPWFMSSDGVLYDKDRTRLVACPATAETVALPSSLTTISVEAFANCHRLSTITVPAAVTEIAQRAFVGCTLLESLTFKGNAPTADDTISDRPEDIIIYKEKSSTGWDVAPWTSFKEIRDTTADASSKILTETSGNLLWRYRIVGSGAELYNEGDAVIPVGSYQTYTYDSEAMVWVGDGVLNIPSELGGYPVTRIGVRAFRNCSALTTVNLPASVTLIDDYAFENCAALASITLPTALTELGAAPFTGTWIASLNLPAKLGTIRGNPVAGCLNLDTLTVDSKNRSFTAVDNVLFNRKKTRLYGVQTFIEDLTVPATVGWIASNAFSSCTLLTKVTYLGNAPVLEDSGWSLYADAPEVVSYAAAKTTGWDGDPASTNMPASGLWPLVGPNQRTIISLTESESTETRGVKTDGTWFYRIVDGYAELWCTNGPGENVCALVNQQTSGALTLPTSIDGYLVKGIAPLALANLRGITSVTVPNTYEWIGDFAFSNCTALASAQIGAAVTKIGRWPFYDTKITTLEIPASVTAIDGNPVAGASMMQTITVADGSTHFATYDGALYDRALTTLLACPATKTALTTPETLTTIAEDAFYGCGDISFGGGTASGALTWHYCVSNNEAVVTNISGTATTVTIPQTLGGFAVGVITVDALNGLSGVKAFVSKSAAYAARNGVLYTADGAHLVRVPDRMTLPYTVTTNTTTITYTITTVTASTGASITTNATSKTTTPVKVEVAGDVSAEDLCVGVTTIDDYAFRGCNVFTNLSGSSVQTVGEPTTSITESGGELIANIITTQKSVEWKESHETILVLPATVTTVEANATTDSGVTLKYSDGTTVTSGDADSEDPETPSVLLAGSLVGEDADAMDASLANTYNGLIVDAEGQTLGTIKVTTGKATGKAGNKTSKITATIKMAGETKSVTVRGTVDPTTAAGSWTASDGRVLELAFARNSMTGTFEGYEIEGIRNVFSLSTKTALGKSERAAAESVLAALKKNYTLAFADVGGWGSLSVSVRTKGSVSVAGKLSNGTTFSLSSQLLVGDSLSCVPVVYTKKTTVLAFSIYFLNDGSEATVVGLEEAAIAPVGNLDEGLAFSVDAGVSDLWGELTLLDEFLPEGVSVEQTGKSKWTVANGAKSGTIKLVNGEAVDTKESENPSNLKLTFSSTTGVFRGSFKIYALNAKGKLKSFTASIYGVVVDGYGYGTATVSRYGTFAIAIIP